MQVHVRYHENEKKKKKKAVINLLLLGSLVSLVKSDLSKTQQITLFSFPNIQESG